MSRLISSIIWSHAQLLRFYPPQFRAAFADEMAAVFTQKAHESSHRGGVALIALVLSELLDLPFRALQEGRKLVLVSASGVITMESRLPVQLFRLFSISLFIVCVVFTLLVVLPFFTLGLHLQSAIEVAFGALGPEAFPLYSTNYIDPNPLPILAIWVMMGAPVWGAVFGSSVLIMLWKFRNRLSFRYRLSGILAVLAGIAPTLFLFLPMGRVVFGWWLD